VPALSNTAKRSVVEQLRRSQVYRDYERAFRETTGLPLSLRSSEGLDVPHRGTPNENRFCSLISATNHSCAACLQAQKQLDDAAGLAPATLTCFAGLSDSAVPIRVGENVVAFLRTGQVLMTAPSALTFKKATKALLKFGLKGDLVSMKKAFLETRVVSKKQYDSALRLLAIFAQHLATLSNQLAVREDAAELPAIGRARAFITENHANEISLGMVARAVNMSAYHFCKTFHKATGLTFTDYVARVRVEKVKDLLLNPNKRISEAAYEAGFQSLSQFNRVFRRVAGEAPTAYRAKLHP
jgi:AraC-like DNA-binding protein/ligand-binding sensor protein